MRRFSMAGGGDVNEASMVDDAVDMDVVVDGSEDEQVVERVALSYEPTYQRFVSKEKTFTQQYSHLYTQRLVHMRPVLKEAALAKWDTGEWTGRTAKRTELSGRS